PLLRPRARRPRHLRPLSHGRNAHVRGQTPAVSRRAQRSAVFPGETSTRVPPPDTFRPATSGVRPRPWPEATAVDSAAPADQRRAEELLRDERSRARSEARAWMCAGADVPQAVDRRAVAGAAGERAPQEVLVERERAAVRVAVHEVRVRGLEVGGGE